MTKEELKKRLEHGETLYDLFDFQTGQNCEIYKGEWQVSDEIIYIPDLYEIPLNESLDGENIKSVLARCCTGNNFLHETKENEKMAKDLFEESDWAYPDDQSIVDGYFSDENNEFEKNYGISLNDYLGEAWSDNSISSEEDPISDSKKEIGQIVDDSTKAEFIGQIIDIFEDFLEEKNIDIPNPEKEEDENLTDAAIIFGSDYGELSDRIEFMMKNWKIFSED